MLFAETEDVFFADQRLASRIDIHIGAELFALLDDAVKGIIVHGQLIAVLCRPAACAVKVTGRSRIHQDGPRDVAPIFQFVFFLAFRSDGGGIDHQILENFLSDTRIKIGPHAFDQFIPVALRILDDGAEGITLSFYDTVFIKLLHPVQHFGDVFIRILIQIREHSLKTEGFQIFSHAHSSHDILPPYYIRFNEK
ncbi:hypothetical protein SDC9_153983 [bioreactor metagenome]|uniref:Uncharacterized protein n=1 Tax=bioreactor metagenome TaxID=1076179 RepID=A0A645EXU4_9ZZZZ